MTKSSKFMPAGACAVLVCIVGTSNAYVDVSSAALIHANNTYACRSLPPTSETSAKGTTTLLYQICACV